MPPLEQVLENPFFEFAAILALAVVVGAIATLLRQPLIVAFIIVGVMVGPAGLGLVHSDDDLQLLGSIGIAILLFFVGLWLDVSAIRTVGTVALAAAIGQVVCTAGLGYLMSLLFGFSSTASVYIGICLTLSSAIIVVKLLTDKRELDSLHGRIAVGILLVQDVLAIIAMILLSALARTGADQNASDDASPVIELAMVLLKGFGLLSIMALLMQFVMPRVVRAMAASQELLVLFCIAWAVVAASGAESLGFSREVGAFLAGVTLAPTPFRHGIGGRLVSLRDFTLLFFFVALGATLNLSEIGSNIPAAIALTLLVIIVNPVSIMVVMGVMGYRKRTSFLAAITTAQIGHFSLIIAAMGVQQGHIDSATAGLITIVCMATIAFCTYAVLYSHVLYDWQAGWLGIFERRATIDESQLQQQDPVDAIVFGVGRYGSNLARGLIDRGLAVLAIDFDPQAVDAWQRRGCRALFGDAGDPELAATLPLQQARWVISSMPQVAVNLTLLATLRQRGFAGRVAVTAHTRRDAERMRQAGAHLVLLPFADAATQAVDLIAEQSQPTTRGQEVDH